MLQQIKIYVYQNNSTLGMLKTGKGNVHPRTGYKGPERERRYSYTLSLISALDGVIGQ
jgi:hypothetical protein